MAKPPTRTHSGMERLATFTVDEILPLIRRPDRDHGIFTELAGFTVKRSAQRLLVFKEIGLSCATCGITGAFFALERVKGTDDRPHLNLYARDEKRRDVLMTRDHIVPLSKGGTDRLENEQPMCKPCNETKADRTNVEVTLAPARRARKKSLSCSL